MRALNFAQRNFKELIRDPLSLVFAMILPTFLLFIFQQFKIPVDTYNIENFTPGIIIFGLTFITMFTATLVAKDRNCSLLTRLAISPMKSLDYLLGYTLALLPLVLIQNVLFFTVALFNGLSFNIRFIFTVIIALLLSLFFIALGILIGCFGNEKSASGISSVVVQLVAFTSGMYFSLDLVGKVFGNICRALPFYHCVELLKTVLNNTGSDILINISVILIYSIITIVLANYVFFNKLRKN